MAEWGDDYDELPQVAAGVADAGTTGSTTFGVDVTGLAGEYVAKAVRAAVLREVAKVAQEAVEEVMTDETLAALRDQAEEEAVAALAHQLDAGSEPAPVEEEEPLPPLYFGSVDEFVSSYLRDVYRRQVGPRSDFRWGARWWTVPEAIIRLEALWRSWESLRQDPATGMSVWWRDHADHHMAVLMSPSGPFCTFTSEEDTNDKGDPLPYVAPPAGMFHDVRDVPS